MKLLLQETRFLRAFLPKKITYVLVRGFVFRHWFIGIARFPEWRQK
jgi:hypothetical protein